jgi:hypothetical protein
MAEVERAGHRSRYLAVLPSERSLYYGLKADESTEPGAKNPFAFVEMVFADPLTVLQAAFPQGPAQVSYERREQQVTLHSRSVHLSAQRRSAYRVEFQMSISADRPTRVSGSWDSRFAEPLASDMSLAGWRYTAPMRLRNLGEARALEKPSKSK